MSQHKLNIVPVTLHSESKNSSLSNSSTNFSISTSTINMANFEISFLNGVDEHIIQTVMRELVSESGAKANAICISIAEWSFVQDEFNCSEVKP